MPLKFIKKLPRNIEAEFAKWRGSLGFLQKSAMYLARLICLVKFE